MIPIAKPWVGDEERAAVLRVLDSGTLVQGPEVAAFENEWATASGATFAVAASSGASALEIALLAHGIGAGDEVITTSFTFIATANAILRVGATPVFVDVEDDTFNIDVTKIAAAITDATKAIMPVHLFGQACAMDALDAVARDHHLAVIADSAQAMGATYESRPIGSFGTACFSLYATKNVMSGEGGMITTSDEGVARRSRMLRSHGRAGKADPEMVGLNARMSELHAALGRAQLARMGEATTRRRANAAFLSEHLASTKLVLPHERTVGTHAWHQYTVRVPSGAAARDRLASELAAAGVASSVFYRQPCHLHAFVAERARATPLPVTERLAGEVLSLPVHPLLTRDELARVAQATVAAAADIA